MTEKTYSNGDVTVVWQPERCIHSAKCVSGLSNVFNPDRRPWIDLTGADSAAVIAQVDQCPTKALSWRREASSKDAAVQSAAVTTAASAVSPDAVSVELLPNGPLIVRGPHTVTGADGKSVQRKGPSVYCRCGASNRKPFCDGTHTRINFKA